MSNALSRLVGAVSLALAILMVIIGIAELARDDAFVGIVNIITAVALIVVGTAKLTNQSA